MDHVFTDVIADLFKQVERGLLLTGLCGFDDRVVAFYIGANELRSALLIGGDEITGTVFVGLDQLGTTLVVVEDYGGTRYHQEHCDEAHHNDLKGLESLKPSGHGAMLPGLAIHEERAWQMNRTQMLHWGPF